jgi:hypothetical protein
MTVRCILALLFSTTHLFSTGMPQSASKAAETPEAAIRGFIYALYSNNAADFRKWTVDDPGREELLGKQHSTAEQIAGLRREVDRMDLTQVAPFTTGGKQVKVEGTAKFQTGTKTIYSTGFRGNLLAIPMVYTESGWKADVRFWLAAIKEAREPQRRAGPEAVAKAFLYYILAKQPQKLAPLSAAPIRGEDYTEANHLPGGDLDQILSLCIEMALVRARAGESFRMPSGEIIRSDPKGETMILVGMLGVSEVAFQLKRIGAEWKIVPQKYFEMLRSAGAI